jgi:hypothetical protein
MIQLLGFSPDAESTVPGVITDCTDFIPYKNGMEAAPSAIEASGVSALAGACIGAAVLAKLDDTKRIFAGTTTKLYELVSGSWDDVTRAVGGDYNGGSDTTWSFTQFGNSSIASNKADAMQRATTGDFSDIAGAPKANIVFSVGAFVMALDVDDGADKPNGWHCSATFDETDWTESVTTQSASGTLVATPGRITAGARLGDYAVAYKTKSIYLAQYVGAPAIWDWQLIPGGEAGCVGKEAIADLGGVHFFVGDDNFWLFDGTRPTPIGDDKVRQWFYDNSSQAFRYRTKCFFDRQNNRVWVFFPSTSSMGECDKTLVYHVLSKQWGRADRTIEAVVNYTSAGITYDTWDEAGATYDTLPDVSYDSQYWLSGGQSVSIFDASHQLQILSGTPGTTSFTSGDAGDDATATHLSYVRLRFATGYSPTSATMQAYSKMVSGDGYTTGAVATLEDGKFCTRQEARWHKAGFTFSGSVRVTGILPDLIPSGDR